MARAGLLAEWTSRLGFVADSTYRSFVEPRTVEARTVADTKNVAPRVGFAYDLTGDNRTVLKAYFGQFRFNSADTLANRENPVGTAQLRYQLNDVNGNRLLDGPETRPFADHRGRRRLR